VNILLEPNTIVENLSQLVERFWLTIVSSHHKELASQLNIPLNSNPLEIHDTQVIVPPNLVILCSLFKILLCLRFTNDIRSEG